MIRTTSTPDAITEMTATWCRSHGWGLEARLVQRAGRAPMVDVLRDVTVYSDGATVRTWISFTSRRDLRAWAGY